MFVAHESELALVWRQWRVCECERWHTLNARWTRRASSWGYSPEDFPFCFRSFSFDSIRFWRSAMHLREACILPITRTHSAMHGNFRRRTRKSPLQRTSLSITARGEKFNKPFSIDFAIHSNHASNQAWTGENERDFAGRAHAHLQRTDARTIYSYREVTIIAIDFHCLSALILNIHRHQMIRNIVWLKLIEKHSIDFLRKQTALRLSI